MLKPKKSLGQNFFVNENLGKTIVEYIKKDNPEIIVEIGPGRAFFTKKLDGITSNLVLIEKDNDLARNLRDEFPKAKVVNTDFLDWEFKELEEFKDRKITFFGSLPYNVSKPIIQKIISSEYFNSNSYFIVQKEVADKYIATSANNNILALRTKLFANTKKLLDINPGSFIPRPKVVSSYICLAPNNTLHNFDIDRFIHFLEQCFRTPRKTLKNNLRGMAFEKIDENLLAKRPSDLSLDQYIKIFTNLH